MMKRSSSICVRRKAVILAAMFILCALLEPAYCETDGTALLLQQAPPQGGIITPDVGVHHFDLNTDVTLTAVPRPGYQFIYWLGDVSDPTANRTVVYLDAPKIVVAIFERAEYKFLDVQERAQSAPGGGLFAGAADYARQGFWGEVVEGRKAGRDRLKDGRRTTTFRCRHLSRRRFACWASAG